MMNARLAITILLVAVSAACSPAPAPTLAPTSAPTSAPTTAPLPTATRVPPTSTAIPPTATLAPTAIPPTATAAATATATAKPIALKVSQNPIGQLLTDGDGRTLYLLTADKQGASVCNDDCVKSWPPLVGSSKASVQGGANASLVGSNQRKDGSTQVTYNGWPLYYRVTDLRPGDTTGQGLDGVWFVLTPEGNALTPGGKPPVEKGGDYK